MHNALGRADGSGLAGLSEQRLIEAWRHEFLHVAMMSAFVAMGCNAIGRETSEDSLGSIEANVPEEPAIYRAIRQGLLDIQPQYSPAMLAAQAAYDELSHAIDILKAARAQLSGRLSASAQEAAHTRLAKAWQRACRLFLAAVEVFEQSGLLREVQASKQSLQSQCPRRLMQLLRAASAGETLAASGLAQETSGALPDWVQRRRWDRRNFNMKCRVAFKGRVHLATIRNISLGGALLDNMPALLRGTPLEITTEDSRALRASVMWARDGALGVKFDEQLLYNDPLIANAGG